MKTISQIFEELSPEDYRKLCSQESPIHEGEARVVNYLFGEIKGFTPGIKYSADSQCSIDSIKRQWCYEIRHSNIRTIEQLNHGLKKLRALGLRFLPTPGEFVKLCKLTPHDKGLPSVDEAYTQACRNSHPSAAKNWSHITVRHAAQGISWELTHEPRRESFPLFEERYLRSIELFERDELKEELPAPEKETISKTSNREVGKAHLSNLLKTLKGTNHEK